MKDQKVSAAAIIGLVLGIIGLLLSAMPIINNFAFVLAVIGLIFGVTGAVKAKKGRSTGMGIAITAIILSLLSLVIVLASQQMYSNAIDEAAKTVETESGKMTGEKTEDLLKTDVDVTIGEFTATKDEYGLDVTKLPVTVTNKNTEKKTYTIQIEAVDANGVRILDESVYANGLGAGQTQNFEAFKYIESSKLEAVKSAEFKIVKVSQL
ncbi:MAG TPA: hypothetical protein VFZ62_03850 [Candidatus Saccharimonadales bacterium]